MSITAKIGLWTITLQAFCLLNIVLIFVITHIYPSMNNEVAMIAIGAISQIALGGGVAGSIGAGAHGLRHWGSKAKTSAELSAEK